MRYTTKDAISGIPKMTNPNEVKDIVFQVGLNDFRKGHTAKEIQESVLEMQLKYHEKFPHARQHLTALPPLTRGHKEVSQLLQKLSLHTESNFISTKVFEDRGTGRLRTNTMKDIHYNELGTKILAKEIKKSLFSRANIGTSHLRTIRNTSVPSRPGHISTASH